MAKSDRAAIDVDALLVEPELTDDRDTLRREGFIQFDEIDLGQVDAGAREQSPHGWNRPDSHHTRVDARHRRADELAERLDAQRSRLLFAGDDESSRAVV